VVVKLCLPMGVSEVAFQGTVLVQWDAQPAVVVSAGGQWRTPETKSQNVTFT
jgi:hypothetical protein